jgi:hypothetical protein
MKSNTVIVYNYGTPADSPSFLKSEVVVGVCCHYNNTCRHTDFIQANCYEIHRKPSHIFHPKFT